MSKSVLGRGLGELLEGTQNSTGPGAVSATADGQVSAAHGVYVSPGVKTILQGGSGAGTAGDKTEGAVDAQARSGADYWPLVRTLLVLADFVLLSVCGLFVLRTAGTTTLLEVAGCTLAITTGALLACVSVLLGSERRQPLSTRRR